MKLNRKLPNWLSDKRLWLAALLVVIAFLLFSKTGQVNPVQEATQKAVGIISGGGGFQFSEDTPGLENLARMQQGCPIKDCIPSIDNPKFQSVTQADEWLNEEDIVFTLDYKGQAKAYPQRILNWHEIVNDVVSGDPLVITFCPLCGSALAFDRGIEGQVLEFGVSGKLLNNDLVMYDRQTESLWQQITGEAVVGEHFGNELKQVSMSGMRWSQFKEEYPNNGQVLSRDTGFSRNYDVYPYGSYEQDSSVYFDVQGGVDRTIHPKAVVYGVEVEGESKAYPQDKLEKEGEVTDNVGGVPIKIRFRNGNIFAENLNTGEEIVTTRLFWFAWKAFRPDTELY